MNSEKIEKLRRRMEEAAILPHEDPQRQALVQEISSIDGRLEQEWLELLQEDERLRLDLARVTAPPDLEDRLLAIPRDYKPHRAWSLRFPRWMTTVAAMIAVTFGVWLVSAHVRDRGHQDALRQFSSLVMASHEGEPELGVVTSDWQVAQAAIQEEVPFDVQPPTLERGLQLVGGKVTTLGGHKVVYTRWQNGDTTYSLYQFCAKDFGLRRPFSRQTIRPKAVRSDTNCQVIIWSEDHCDYALVVKAINHSPTRPTSA